MNWGYPGNVLFVPTVSGGIHPTQKPVELCEYLIRTYTHPGELVADICVGSGTTAIAAINTERLTARAVEFVKSHPAGAVIAVLCVLLMFAMQSCSSTMLMLGNAGAGALGASTYPCEDRDGIKTKKE